MTRMLPALTAMILLLSACGGRTAAWHAKGDRPEREVMLLNEANLFSSEGDAFWAARPNPERVKDAIVRWEQAVSIDPEAHEVFIKITRAYAYLVPSIDQSEAEERVRAAEAGLLAAESALMVISPEFGERMSRGANLAEGMEILGAEAARPLYWYAINLETWLEQQPKLVQMRHRGWVELVLDRVMEIDESVGNAALHRYLAEKKFALGESEAGVGHLTRAVELSPDFLLNRVAVAEKVAIATGDRALFEEHMGYVLGADDDVLPGCIPENAEAKQRARALLARMDEFFAPVIVPVEEPASPEEDQSDEGEAVAADEDPEEDAETADGDAPPAVEVFVPAPQASSPVEASSPEEAVLIDD